MSEKMTISEAIQKIEALRPANEHGRYNMSQFDQGKMEVLDDVLAIFQLDQNQAPIPISRGCVQISKETAELISKVFLPANPKKMRSAHPDTVKAVDDFRAALRATEGTDNG